MSNRLLKPTSQKRKETMSEIFCENQLDRDAQAQVNHASQIACRPSGTQCVEPATKPFEGQTV